MKQGNSEAGKMGDMGNKGNMGNMGNMGDKGDIQLKKSGEGAFSIQATVSSAVAR